MLAGELTRWKTAIFAAVCFGTIVLALSTSASRFRFYGLSPQVKIDVSRPHQYQKQGGEAPPAHVPTYQGSTSTSHDGGAHNDAHSRPKPSQRVVAMVFAGRKEYVSILDCYLQRNLVRNGGWLDEVMWIMHGNTTADIVYVNDLTDNVPEYTRHDIYPEAEDAPRPFGEAYKLCQPGTYYVKIDDDVVFMEDNAIQAIVQRKIDNPGNLMVSGNVLNGPALCHIHHEMNTSKPFLPEMQKPADFVEDDRRFLVNWRPSTLPQWKAPEGYSFSLASPAPFNGHRWLPVHGSDGNKVALSEPDHTKNGTDDVTWVTAAQTHYSFLDNLEKHELKRYKFEVLEYPKDARTINFVAFDGDDASRHPVQGDDDLWWTKTLPSKLKRPALLDGTAMVVHFGTYSQTYTHGGKPGHGLRETDLLRRYRSYANEFICGKPWGSPML